MMHMLMAYLDYISTRPLLIVLTGLAIAALVIYGRMRAQKGRA
jgi:hypothetical protein